MTEHEAADEAASWQPARLIPTSGIRGARERETRATSALLSVLGVVDEFGRSILRGRFGAPAGAAEAFIEVPLTLADGRAVRPDGLVRVRRGRRTWTALFEVKTGSSELELEQVESYVDAAREHGFDAVVTISNQIMPATGSHPVAVSRTKLRRVELHHISWVALLTEAVMEHEHRGVEDPEQAWILEQLIAYLEHPGSGVLQFADMGQHWTTVRNGVRAGTLAASDEGVGDVVARWDELSRYLCLQLGRALGADVQQVLTRRERQDVAGRQASQARALADEGTLECTLRVPGVIAPVNLRADLKTRTIGASMTVGAPSEGRPRTRVNWLVRQLRDAAPREAIRIDTYFESRSASTSALLADIAADPDAALLDDRNVPPRGFRVTLTRDMGVTRGSDAKSFIGSLSALLAEYHEVVGSRVRAWAPRTPRLPDQAATPEPAREAEAADGTEETPPA